MAALHSPDTGIVDFARVARALAAQLGERGAAVTTGAGVTGVSAERRPGARSRHARGETRARFAVFCAGGWSDRLAVMAGAPAEPRIVPFRGAYLRLQARAPRAGALADLPGARPQPAVPRRAPDPPHRRRRAGGPHGAARGARDAYALRTLRPRDLAATFAWPGSWRMFRRWWRTGLTEIRHAASRRAFVAAAADVRARTCGRATSSSPSPACARRRSARDGSLVDDFVVHETERAIHVRNAPSPAATSSLAIARLIADRAEAGLA